MSVVIKFPIVVYPSEYDDAKAFTAHCLNMDLVADDAPPEYWKRLKGAKSVPLKLLKRV